MREVKFRAWDKEEKRMLYDVGIVKIINNYHPCWFNKDKGEFKVVHKNDFKLMQYTGLKDKNGKEIYEGDIVKIDDEVYEIKWVGAGLSAVKGERRFDWWKFAKIDGGSYIPEIIGNVYENPGLLENEK